MSVVDATCPFVKRAQTLALELVKEGYALVVLGDAAHPEVDVLLFDTKLESSGELHRRFRAAGGTCLVDVTLPGIGRDPAWLRRIATRTGLHIVMGTGWYREPYYPPEALIDRRSAEELADQMIGEHLRKRNKRSYLIANKIDNIDPEAARAEFSPMGLGDAIPVAGAHGRGITQMLEIALRDFPKDDVEEEEGDLAAFAHHPALADFQDFLLLGKEPFQCCRHVVARERHDGEFHVADFFGLDGFAGVHPLFAEVGQQFLERYAAGVGRLDDGPGGLGKTHLVGRHRNRQRVKSGHNGV